MNTNEFYAKALTEYNAKNYDAALKILDEIKKLDPAYKDTYYMEAFIWHETGNPIKEFSVLEKILSRLNNPSPEEKDMVAKILLNMASSCDNLNMIEQALNFYHLSVQFASNKEIGFRALDNAISTANTAENFSVDDFRALYNEYKKYLTNIKPFPRKFYNHKKIRVGFLSGDFCGHPVVVQSWSLLTKLDKNFFKTYLYSNGKVNDNITEKLRLTADGWRDIYNLTDEQAAKLVRDDEIDILFDLSGHTAYNRLRVATYRPASVQISGIGDINSTGLDCFDYFLSDETCAGDETFFTEKVIKLPHSHFCHEPSTKLEPADAPPCLKNDFVTFGSFNQLKKVTDPILSAWKKILDAVPNSKLIIKNSLLNIRGWRNFIGERLKKFDFKFNQVEMRSSSSTWLAEYGDVDIALDTFPYTGGVTTCEALYMGVPVVSLYGKRHGSRFGLSILKNIGLEELAVDSYDEYINRAVMLAGDPLMDSANYLREVQDAFIKILSNERQKSH